MVGIIYSLCAWNLYPSAEGGGLLHVLRGLGSLAETRPVLWDLRRETESYQSQSCWQFTEGTDDEQAPPFRERSARKELLLLPTLVYSYTHFLSMNQAVWALTFLKSHSWHRSGPTANDACLHTTLWSTPRETHTGLNPFDCSHVFTSSGVDS